METKDNIDSPGLSSPRSRVNLDSGFDQSLTPIRRLPAEILTQVFMDVLLTEPAPTMSVPFDCAPLWQLGHVCARWRSIVFSDMPLAWSTIKIDFRSTRVASRARRSVDILRACLERTGDCLLTIAFACSFNIRLSGGDEWICCLELLVDACKRWKAIDISIPITVLSKLVPVKGQLAFLETLNLSLEPLNAHSLPHTVDVFEDAPRLTSVTVSSHLSMKSFRLPWHQITSYRTQRTEVSDCVEVIRLAPQLRSLQIRLDAISRRNVIGDTGTFSNSHILTPLPIPHKNLTSLSLNGLMRPGFEHALFQFLRKLEPPSGESQVFFPSLINFRVVTGPGSLANFATCASCFGSSLTKLTVRSVFDAETDYTGAREFLSSLPTVRELAFGVCFHHSQAVVNILYDILAVPSPCSRNGKAVLPKMEELGLDIDYGDGETFLPGWAVDPMKEMIQSRRRLDENGEFVRLRRFHLYLASWNDSRGGEFMGGLENLGEEGFEVRISRGF